MSASCLGKSIKVTQCIPLSYNWAEPNISRLQLILTLFPDWSRCDGEVEFKSFTGGITNTLFKALYKKPGLSAQQIDDEAVLLRVYGKGTDILVDREREFKSHCMLSQYNLAPPVLARFENGLIYRFIRGDACSPQDLGKECVWRGVARKMGEWHGILPVASLSDEKNTTLPSSDLDVGQVVSSLSPYPVEPNIWTVMQKWITALPTPTPEDEDRKTILQKELEWLVEELGNTKHLPSWSLVFGHCDLLSGNIVIQPHKDGNSPADGVETVSFIDYEYAMPCPAAFEIASHFSEWVGFECDYNLLPTRSVRREFLREYVRSYRYHNRQHLTVENEDVEVRLLFDEVDRFRGVPGFFWGLCARIQHITPEIEIEFGSAEYSEKRLGEYWVWRGEAGGKEELLLRERRWAQEA